MKKNDVLLITGAAVFSALFYNQSAGLNYLLFTIMLAALMVYFNRECLSSKQWWMYAFAALFAASMVIVVNSALSLFATVIALLVLSSKTLNRENSTLLCLFLGLFSLVSSLGFFFQDYFQHPKVEPTSTAKSRSRKILLSVFLSLLIGFIFLHLYRASNPLFEEFTADINLDWLSVGWVLCAVLGFFVLYGLVYTRSPLFLKEKELLAMQNIQPSSQPTLEKGVTEYTVLFLFILLNFMLLLLNILDINMLYIRQSLPAHMSLSDFVHQAVWNIVGSIVLALGLIIWFFRKDMNFTKTGRRIKQLVYAWMIQNLVVVLHTIYRNSVYIGQYQLSYLRIGVFVFILLCVIGLVLTAIKIRNQKSTWFLVTQNVFVWFTVLILSSAVNWDRLITRYNIQHTSDPQKLDVYYLSTLSDANLPDLAPLLFDKQVPDYHKDRIRNRLVDWYFDLEIPSWVGYNLRYHHNIQTYHQYIK